MRLSRLLFLTLGMAGLLGLGGFVMRSCGADLADGPFRRRYGLRPPEQAFEFAFKQPVPPGVTHLRATGESWLAGTNVWLVFRTSDPVLEQLLESANTLIAPTRRGVQDNKELRDFGEIWDSRLDEYDTTSRLNWRNLYQARKVDTCVFGDHSSLERTIWYVRETGTAYVFVYGI